jgi:hypothetical protein
MILKNHSSIVDYPINTKLHPFASKLKFMEIDLNTNEYLLIPSRWIHWIITEPATIALSFEIQKCRGLDENIIYKSIKNNKPYKSTGKKNDFTFFQVRQHAQVKVYSNGEDDRSLSPNDLNYL